MSLRSSPSRSSRCWRAALQVPQLLPLRRSGSAAKAHRVCLSGCTLARRTSGRTRCRQAATGRCRRRPTMAPAGAPLEVGHPMGAARWAALVPTMPSRENRRFVVAKRRRAPLVSPGQHCHGPRRRVVDQVLPPALLTPYAASKAHVAHNWTASALQTGQIQHQHRCCGWGRGSLHCCSAGSPLLGPQASSFRQSSCCLSLESPCSLPASRSRCAGVAGRLRPSVIPGCQSTRLGETATRASARKGHNDRNKARWGGQDPAQRPKTCCLCKQRPRAGPAAVRPLGWWKSRRSTPSSRGARKCSDQPRSCDA